MSIADLWVVLTVLGFFGLCVLLVRGCDRIIGPDDAEDFFDEDTEESPAGVAQEVAR